MIQTYSVVGCMICLHNWTDSNSGMFDFHFWRSIKLFISSEPCFPHTFFWKLLFSLCGIVKTVFGF